MKVDKKSFLFGTLSPLHVNIGSTIFVSGQAYVALSRAVGPDTLRVFSFCKNKKIEANPKVKQFYSSLER